MISRGTLRRLSRPILHPILRRYFMSRTVRTQVGGFRLQVLPSVFHPRFFGSSAILGQYVEAQNLKGKTFLDMGTGSGIVGLFAARAGALVTGLDVNPQAVECAKGNAAAAGYAIEYLLSDLFAAVAGRRFDLIAWNPPFFPRAAANPTDAAWYAGEGFLNIGRFAAESAKHLNPGGSILLVLSLDVDIKAFAAMFETHGFAVRQVSVERWGFGETMVVLEVR